MPAHALPERAKKRLGVVEALQGRFVPLELQLEAAEEAEGECWAEVDGRYGDAPPLSEEEAYRAWVTAECLRAQGVDVPYSPTFDT